MIPAPQPLHLTGSTGSLSPCTAPANHESILLPNRRRHPTLTQYTTSLTSSSVLPWIPNSFSCCPPAPFHHLNYTSTFLGRGSRAIDSQYLQICYGYQRHSQARQYRHGSPRQFPATEQQTILSQTCVRMDVFRRFSHMVQHLSRGLSEGHCLVLAVWDRTRTIVPPETRFSQACG
ncbi:hypothetical protein BDP67DRAFT_621991 [Colletotrichum lupini]|nr:hypothetical protein BDP67DRAFT_621991 [Colletotrichum lupini]